MDDTTTKALQMAQTLIKAGKQEQAEDILVMIVRSSPNVEEAWYLLGFALIDTQKRIDSFQQLLCINSSHQLAKQLLANLQTIRLVSPFTEDTPTVPQNAFMAGRLSQISNEPGSETADQSFVCAPAQPVEVSEPDLTCADDSSQMQSALRLEVETETATPPAKSRARQRSMRIMVGVATLVVLFSGLTIRWLWRSAAQVAVLPPVTNPTSALATSATPLPITSTITTLPQFNAEFRGTACPFSIPLGTQIKCGLVKVPRDRAKNFTDLIMLPVVLFHSKKAGADVIVYLQGGPGQEAINWSLANFDDFVSPLLDE